jgi:hypothetical protein
MTVSKRNVGERPFDRLLIRHVRGERMRGDPDFLGDLRGRGLARVKYHDLRTRRGKCKRDRPTNAAAAASHDGNFAFKQEIRKVKHVYFPFWFVSNFAEYEFRQKSVVLRRDGL